MPFIFFFLFMLSRRPFSGSDNKASFTGWSVSTLKPIHDYTLLFSLAIYWTLNLLCLNKQYYTCKFKSRATRRPKRDKSVKIDSHLDVATVFKLGLGFYYILLGVWDRNHCTKNIYSNLKPNNIPRFVSSHRVDLKYIFLNSLSFSVFTEFARFIRPLD